MDFEWTLRRRFFSVLGKLLGIGVETEPGVRVGCKWAPDLNIYGADGMTIVGVRMN